MKLPKGSNGIQQNNTTLAKTQSIEEIMSLYGAEIKQLVNSYLHNSSEAEDITQEVFVTVYKKLHTFQGKSSLKTWIYSIAINKSKDHLRSFRGRQQRLLKKIQQELTFSENDQHLDDIMAERDEETVLYKKVMSLKLIYREVIILFYFKDFSVKEISTMLVLNENTVKTRLDRARQQLKLLIERGEKNGRKTKEFKKTI